MNIRETIERAIAALRCAVDSVRESDVHMCNSAAADLRSLFPCESPGDEDLLKLADHLADCGNHAHILADLRAVRDRCLFGSAEYRAAVEKVLAWAKVSSPPPWKHGCRGCDGSSEVSKDHGKDCPIGQLEAAHRKMKGGE